MPAHRLFLAGGFGLHIDDNEIGPGCLQFANIVPCGDRAPLLNILRAGCFYQGCYEHMRNSTT
ncbi:MAG: hypothetical protein ACJ8BW_17105, partial [Ktedonobacteraceae bacterium]